MELKLQLVATAGGGSLSSFSSPGTPGDVFEGGGGEGVVIENAVRKSDQRSKPKTKVKHKHGRKVAKFPPSKIPFNAGFHVDKHPGRAALAGIAVIPKWNAEIEIGVVICGGEVVVEGVNNALICPAGVQRD